MSDTPTQPQKMPCWLSATLFVLVLFIVTIGLFYTMIAGGQAAPSAPAEQRGIAERLQKVGAIDIHIVAANREPRSGEEVYKAVCSACHATGVAGAPKFGDAAAWAPRLAQGQDALEQAPIKGYTGSTGTMPPQSGGAATDYEIIRAAVYMVNAGGGKLKEPPAPAEVASK